jgi:peroxiredoxin
VIELEPNLGWINTDRALGLGGELRGQVVLLFFWDSGRIGCGGALAEVLSLAVRFAHEPVVLVGVHDTRFAGMAEYATVRRIIEHAELAFPVVVDDSYAIWRKYTVRSSPTTIVIDPTGEIAARASGEGNRELLDRTIARVIDEHRTRDTLATGRLAVPRAIPNRSVSCLFGPEKVLAQTPSVGRPGYLFVADTAQHRVIVADWPDRGGSASVRAVYGDGHPGCVDGSAGEARFANPRGMGFDPERGLLYVADTGSHAIRLIDLDAGSVRTIVGRSQRGHDAGGGASGTNQGLNAPWDVALDAKAGRLFIAMAGVHQVWSAELDTMVTRAIVGSGEEEVIDGVGAKAAFAQPKAVALSTDRRTLFCVDSEGSAVRAIDLATRTVRTVAGGQRRGGVSPLDAFGLRDGDDALFARPSGLSIREEADGGELVVADAGNGCVRLVDRNSGQTQTIELGAKLCAPADVCVAGALASRTEQPCVFIADTHRHRIIRLDVEGPGWTEIGLAGLDGPMPEAERAIFNVPMHAELTMFVPGASGLGAGEAACFRVSSWVQGRQERVISQRTLTGSTAGREQAFVVPPECVDVEKTLLAEMSTEGGERRLWHIRFGPDGGEPRLRG